MSKAIGIDLGTTNSCVSVVEGGKPVIIPNAAGERTTPSVVAFTQQGERLVGAVARRQAVTNASRTIASVKRRMGSDWRIGIDGKSFSAQEISAMILRRLKEDAENYLGERVTDAVITVPAYFNDMQRQATKDAGRIAGLNVLRIINEPTSAALAYGLDNGAPQKVLVYDLGGGTFDVSIIEIGEGVIEVLATGGDNRLGGDDFDERITQYLISEFKRTKRVDLSRDAAALVRIREAAEAAKKELSLSESASIHLPYLAQGSFGPLHMELTLARTKFNELTRELVERTVDPMRQALADAGISSRELGMVLLVGGSTRIPAVQEKVRMFLGKIPSKGINPDECVAQGAAIQANTLSGNKMTLGRGQSLAGAKEGGILLLDITPLSLSIETLGGVATRLVERNTTLPTHYSQVFTTAAPFQSSVEIHVLQGERPMARDNKTIGKFRLNGIKRAMAGVPQIEVTFDIDVNGILKVSARDLDTGREQSITISDNDKMTDAEIEQARRDAEQYAAQDGVRRDALTVTAEAQQLLAFTDRALGVAGKKLDKAERGRVKDDCEALRKLIKKCKVDKVDASELSAIKSATAQLKSSGEHVCALFAEMDGARK